VLLDNIKKMFQVENNNLGYRLVNIDNLKRIGEETFLINKDIIKKFMNI
jgi:hypothetical protein